MFQIDRGAGSFQVPIRLGANDYDDTEMVQAAEVRCSMSLRRK
jgi:hypothetical protein